VRIVLAAAAVPVLVVALWYGKNLAQVGEFTGSTWFGINFSKMTNSMLTVPERRALYDNGTISAVSLVPPFSNPDRYYGAVPKPGATGVAVLDQEMKPSGIPNFNNTLFVAVSRQYARDALKIVVARPAAYLRGLAESYLIYFLPASAYLFLDGNAGHIKALVRFASIAFNGRFGYHSDHSLRQTQPARYYLQGLLNTSWFLVLAYVLVLAFGLVLLLRRSSLAAAAPVGQRIVHRSSFPASDSSFTIHPSSLLFVLFNVAWVTLLANAVEVGENNRFRFVTDPLVFVLLAALAVGWLARRRVTVNDE
jgi:NADH:ubiquinone oxidoreductase subunit 3 (subunit A)